MKELLEKIGGFLERTFFSLIFVVGVKVIELATLPVLWSHLSESS